MGVDGILYELWTTKGELSTLRVLIGQAPAVLALAFFTWAISIPYAGRRLRDSRAIDRERLVCRALFPWNWGRDCSEVRGQRNGLPVSAVR